GGRPLPRGREDQQPGGGVEALPRVPARVRSETGEHARWLRRRWLMPWILKETEIRYRRTAKLQSDRHVDSSRVVNDVMHEADDKFGCATGVGARFIVLAVDAKNRILGWHLAGKGDVSNCPASPGAIFRAALAVGASGIVLVHNHPSGEPEPSRDDVALT